MRLVGIEHCDDFDNEAVFWIEVFDLPSKIQDEAKRIDGEDYDPNCFGMCVSYDVESNEFNLAPDVADTTVYYVNNNGDKTWFFVEIGEDFLHELYSMCECEYLKNKSASFYDDNSVKYENEDEYEI